MENMQIDAQAQQEEQKAGQQQLQAPLVPPDSMMVLNVNQSYAMILYQAYRSYQAALKQTIEEVRPKIDILPKFDKWFQNNRMASRKEQRIFKKNLWAQEQHEWLMQLIPENVNNFQNSIITLDNWFCWQSGPMMDTLIHVIREFKNPLWKQQQDALFSKYNYQQYKYLKNLKAYTQSELVIFSELELAKLALAAQDKNVYQYTKRPDGSFQLIHMTSVDMKTAIANLMAQEKVAYSNVFRNPMSQAAIAKLGEGPDGMGSYNQFYKFVATLLKYQFEQGRDGTTGQRSLGQTLRDGSIEIGVHCDTISDILISDHKLINSLQHWNARGYTPSFTKYGLSIQNKYYQNMYVCIIRSQQYQATDFIIQSQGDFIYWVGQGQTLSLPKGSFVPEDSIFIVVTSEVQNVIPRVKTVELCHYLSTILVTDPSNVQQYDRSHKLSKPIMGTNIGNGRGIIGSIISNKANVMVDYQYARTFEGEITAVNNNKLQMEGGDKQLEFLLDTALQIPSDHNSIRYKRQAIVNFIQSIKNAAPLAQEKFKSANKSTLKQFAEILPAQPSSDLVKMMLTNGMDETEYHQMRRELDPESYRAGTNYEKNVPYKRARV